MITVVCGFPRSGTSLMMQMLQAGGMDLFYSTKVAYETPLILNLPKQWKWLQRCEGQAVKIIDPQVFRPHPSLHYRFIWMDRDPLEQAKSQAKLIAAVVGKFAPGQIAALADSLRQDRAPTLELLEGLGEVCIVRFEHLIRYPVEQARLVANFVGNLSAGGRADAAKMASVVKQRPAECLPYMLEYRLILEER